VRRRRAQDITQVALNQGILKEKKIFSLVIFLPIHSWQGQYWSLVGISRAGGYLMLAHF
jgi:hypothetical protein